MKITHVSTGEARIPVDKGGGVETFILATSKHLVRMGHDVVILDRKYGKADPDIEDLDGVKIVRLAAPRFNLVFPGLPKLGGFLAMASHVLSQFAFVIYARRYLGKATDSDVIHMHVSISCFLFAIMSRSLRKKLVYTSHSNRVTKDPLSLRDRIAIMPQYWVIRWARKVTVPDELMRARVIERTRVSPERVSIIPYDVDTRDFNPDLDINGVRRKYELRGKTTVLFVGRISPEKGIDYLLRASGIVVNEFGYGDTQFILVGPIGGFISRGAAEHTEYSSRLLRLIKDLGLQSNVKLVGSVPFDDLRRLYVACDMFVLPSLAEAFPKAVIEAMACSKPTIGTKVGGILTEIEDGQSGFLIDPANERQIAEKIRYLIENPTEAKKMGVYGRKLVEERYDSAKIAERCLRIYREVHRDISKHGVI